MKPKVEVNRVGRSIFTFKWFAYSTSVKWNKVPVGYVNINLLRTNHITPGGTNAVDTIMALTPAGVNREKGGCPFLTVGARFVSRWLSVAKPGLVLIGSSAALGMTIKNIE